MRLIINTAKIKTSIIYWKLYPVVTVFRSTIGTIRVKFSENLDNPFAYKAIG